MDIRYAVKTHSDVATETWKNSVIAGRDTFTIPAFIGTTDVPIARAIKICHFLWRVNPIFNFYRQIPTFIFSFLKCIDHQKKMHDHQIC